MIKVRLLKYRQTFIATAECVNYELIIEKISWFGLKRRRYKIMHAQPFVHCSLKDITDAWDEAIKTESPIQLNPKDYIFRKTKP